MDETGTDEIGVFRRLGVPARTAMTGLVAGLAGTGALLASLLFDWQRMVISAPDTRSDGQPRLIFGLAALPYAEVYLLGVIGLLAILGTAVVRPDRARWLRFTAVGLGLGLAALVMVMIFSARSAIVTLYLGDTNLTATVRILAGGYWALAAVGVPVLGVWLTAGPASAVPAPAPAAAAVPTPRPSAPEPLSGRVGFLDGLTVTSSEPIDVGAGTDVLRT